MRFLMLGSLEVRAPGRRISITAPKQRTVLAALLLNADHEVPIDRLARFIWDDAPPATAQTTLQSYIYRLRQVLRPLPVELQTSGDSYLLNVDEAEIDLMRFQRKVHKAREHAQRGRLHNSVAELRSALGIWRGNALSGVPGRLIRQEARLLEAERTAAQEDLFATEIRLGNHRQIIPELHKAVAGNPFHEALRALLILSLYASARQVEALQQFAQIRRRLRDDLGIDPGQELQELHKSILEQRPAEQIIRPAFGSWVHQVPQHRDPIARPRVTRS